MFKVGQLVWLNDPTRKIGVCSKLSAKWKGPYIITKCMDDTTYIVKKTAKQMAKAYHVNRLMSYEGQKLPMEKECWICPEKFDTTKQLKSHLASSVHSKMEVVCPFCLDRPTKYKRVWELKDHCNRFHKPAMQDMRPDVLSEGNAYYLAVHPACFLLTLSQRSEESHAGMAEEVERHLQDPRGVGARMERGH
ncbi:unnamed protein product [Mytilus edulis]|uniref:C2H2-type domain-containing protein n=1 Tax=Mytilus edulis TaxID=6550 RepID=A0A8S3TDS7_MYTED|nr:unnamed protein product [Mytilus edulis]